MNEPSQDSICFLFFSAVSINEFKNNEVIDGLDKRSEDKGMLGLCLKKDGFTSECLCD